MFGAIRSATLAMVIAAVAVSAVPKVADAQMAGDAIKARQGLMKNNGKNFGVIAGFVKKGKGTAAAAASSARKIASNVSLVVDLFPKGTSMTDSVAKNRAKPEIWQDRAKFVAAAANLVKLAWDLSLAAETGDKGAMGKAMGAMGKNGCTGCHKLFRGPKN